MDPKGKAALVTGASSGIGAAIVRALVMAGSRVALAARTESQMKQVCASLPEEAQTLVLPTDVSKEDDVRKAVDATVRHFGGIDILINNAGFGIFKPITELSVEEFDAVLNVNLRGVFLGIKYVLPHMYEKGSGTVITISSLAGKHGFISGGAYCSSKFGLMGLMECAFHEARSRNVRMVAVCPGSVATPFFDEAGATLPNPDRVLQVDDVAATVIHAITLPDRALLREIDIRPTNPKGG